MEYKGFQMIRIYFIAGIFIVLLAGIASAQTELFRDKENCMLCHRYPTMGKYIKTGENRNYYVNGEGYSASVHGGMRCSACHKGLDKIPHSNIRKVDCSIKCHIENSSSRKEFSHIDVVRKYEASVHGMGSTEKPIPFPEDLPSCTYCHNNRGYYSSEEFRGKKDNTPDDAAVVFRRSEGQMRSQLDVIEMCASCHEDPEKMERHGLESIETYKDTFHWEALKYGVVNAPDCISCHIPVGFSLHTIKSENDPLSSVNIANRVKTCSNEGGIQTCHPDSTTAFASGHVHQYGLKAQLATEKSESPIEGEDKSLIVEQAEDEISEKELFQYKVLEIIRLIYKLLIGGTIGFMSVHQLLDYIRARKKHKTPH